MHKFTKRLMHGTLNLFNNLAYYLIECMTFLFRHLEHLRYVFTSRKLVRNRIRYKTRRLKKINIF